MTGTPAARARAARVPRFRRSPLARTASSSAGSSARSPMIASWHSMVRSAECVGSSSERRSIGMEADTGSSASAPSTGGGRPVGGDRGLRPGGTLVIVGTGLAHPTLEQNRVLLRELVVTGAFNYDATGFADALDLLSSGVLPLSGLVSPVNVRLEDIMRTVEGLAAGTIAQEMLVTQRWARGQ